MTGYEMSRNIHERHGFRYEDYDCLDLISIKSRSEWNGWSTSPKLILLFNKTAFKTVLKKSPNIQCIGIQNAKLGFNQSNEIVEMVTKYCFKITEIYLDFNLITIRNFSKFISKFGQTIRKCTYYSGYYLEYRQCQHLLDYCPNLEQLNLLCSYLINNHLVTFRVFNLLHLTRVKQLIFILWLPEETKLIEKFIDNNRNSLEVIHIWVQTKELNQFQVIFEELKNLTTLKSLKINFLVEYEPHRFFPGTPMFQMPETFVDLLCSISPFCPLVKDIDINAYSSETLFQKLFESIQQFSQLKQLKLKFNNFNQDKLRYQYKSETLKNCRQLTHLSLNVPLIDEHFFTNIHNNLPKLQFLNPQTIKTNYLSNSIKILSNINCLKNIQVFLYDYNEAKEVKFRQTLISINYSLKFKKLYKLVINGRFLFRN